MTALWLSEKEVQQVLDMDLALEAVEEGLRSIALDEAVNIPRARAQTDRAMLHLMGAACKTPGYLGFKAYVTSAQGAHFVVGLYDGKNGAPLAFMEADYLGQIRTGAASGVATRYLARADANQVGIIGSGRQARTQLMALCRVRPITHVQVYSRSEQRRRAFAADMSRVCQVEIEPVATPELAARDKDIVVTATTSREPVLYGNWLSPGVHLNVIGSNFLGKAEIDLEVVRRCDVLVVDNKEQARREAGDLIQAIEAGILEWAEVYELPYVIAGRNPGRQHPQDITLFKSVGIGIEDVAVAGKVFERARQAGLGKPVDQ